MNNSELLDEERCDHDNRIQDSPSLLDDSKATLQISQPNLNDHHDAILSSEMPPVASRNATLSPAIPQLDLDFENLDSTINDISHIDLHNVTPPAVNETESNVNYYNPIPSTSGISSVKTHIENIEKVTVKDLLPLPKKSEQKNIKAMRKQHATVITGTPNKIVLFEKEQKKLAKLAKAQIKVEKKEK
ncbi:unnamed protein product [Parnassius apollo]|uniref:(apollo) hypothetical protein n=1 Tax=Parnassius apollo TaxID=110799 RepID=A0A8S3WL82_PARAO|nr:unnamed protein product [Parnassius apollo]